MGISPEALGFKPKVLGTFLGHIAVLPNGCWLWNGYKNNKGYGQFKLRGKIYYAHRLSFLLNKGEIESGLELDHLCKTPLCVNPDHLEAVTHQENMLRSNSVSGIAAKKTHCTKGHPYDNINTYIVHRKDGRVERHCRSCKKYYKSAEWKALKSA
jgi:hypothetical protein